MSNKQYNYNCGQRASDYSIYKQWGGTHDFMRSHGIKHGEYAEAKEYADGYRQADEQDARYARSNGLGDNSINNNNSGQRASDRSIYKRWGGCYDFMRAHGIRRGDYASAKECAETIRQADKAHARVEQQKRDQQRAIVEQQKRDQQRAMAEQQKRDQQRAMAEQQKRDQQRARVEQQKRDQQRARSNGNISNNNCGQRFSDYYIYKQWGGTHEFMRAFGIKYGEYDEAKELAESFRQAWEQEARDEQRERAAQHKRDEKHARDAQHKTHLQIKRSNGNFIYNQNNCDQRPSYRSIYLQWGGTRGFMSAHGIQRKDYAKAREYAESYIQAPGQDPRDEQSARSIGNCNCGCGSNMAGRASDYSIYKEWGGTHAFMQAHGICDGDYAEAKELAESYRQSDERARIEQRVREQLRGTDYDDYPNDDDYYY